MTSHFQPHGSYKTYQEERHTSIRTDYMPGYLRLTAHGSLVPRLFPPPIFDCLQYANTEGEGLGDLGTCGKTEGQTHVRQCLTIQIPV